MRKLADYLTLSDTLEYLTDAAGMDHQIVIDRMAESFKQWTESVAIYAVTVASAEPGVSCIPPGMYKEVAETIDSLLGDAPYEARLIVWTVLCSNLVSYGDMKITENKAQQMMKKSGLWEVLKMFKKPPPNKPPTLN